MNFKKMKSSTKILIFVCVIFTMFRIFLAMKIPLILQADAYYDDFLFVEYAKELVNFNWLGNYNFVTLAKGCSFSFFLIFNYLLGIPYSFSLIILYIFSIILLIISIRKIISNKYFLSILYVFLLYSPIMFHVENVQKVYRGGVIISFALIIISGVIGIYTRINSSNKKMLFWSLLTSVSLSYFWFLKEDSIWILPFVLGGLILSIIKAIRLKTNKKNIIKKIILIILPIIVLFISNLTYKTINYINYGEFAVTDRGDTYFKEVIHDLLQIDSKNTNKDVWITRDMLEKAYKFSPTLSIIKDSMNEKYEYRATISGKTDGQINGDIIYWVIKEAANDSGIYDKNGLETNNYYKRVHFELQKAFKKGNLKKNNDIYISSVAKGIKKEEVNEYLKLMKESFNVIINYSENNTEIKNSTGEINNIALFNQFTMSQFILPNTNNIHCYIFVNIVQKIVGLYQKTGSILFYMFIICFILLSLINIFKLFNKKLDNDNLIIYLILIGLLLTSFTLFFGVTFFCRFLTLRKVYDYSSGIIPIIQFLELTTIYIFIHNIYSKIKNKNIKL